MSHAGGQWKILDLHGYQVGSMARSWVPPHGMAIAGAQVQGIFVRRAEDDEDEGRRRTLLSCTWEVVVPQLFLSREPSPGVSMPGEDSTG